MATGQVRVMRVQTSRIGSLVDGKVAMAKSNQKPAIRKPAPAQIEIRYFMFPLPTSIILRLSAPESVTADNGRSRNFAPSNSPERRRGRTSGGWQCVGCDGQAVGTKDGTKSPCELNQTLEVSTVWGLVGPLGFEPRTNRL